MQESTFSDGELQAYEWYWDAVSTEKTIIGDSLRKGRLEGLAEGIHAANVATAKNLLAMRTLEFTAIAAATNLSITEVEQLAKNQD